MAYKQSRYITQHFDAITIHKRTNNNNVRFTNIGYPIAETDAATKQYVDDSIIEAGLTQGTGIIITGGEVEVSSNLTHVTQVGNISDGTWSGNTIQVGYGGTGRSSITATKLVIGNGSDPIIGVDELTFANSIFTSSVPIEINSTIEATGIGSGGSITTLGGVGISKNLYVGEGITASNLTITGNITVNNINIGGSATFTTTSAGSAIYTNVTTTNSNITNSTMTNVNTTRMTSTSALITSATIPTILSTNINTVNITCGSIGGTNVTTTSIASTFGNILGITTNNMIGTNITATNIRGTGTTIGTINATTGIFTNIMATNVTITSNLTSNNLTTGTINATNGRITTITTSALVTTNMESTNTTITNLNVSAITSTNNEVTNMTSTNIVSTNTNVTNITTTTLRATFITGVTASTIPTMIASNISTTNITSGEIIGSNITLTNMTCTNTRTTNITATNIINTSTTMTNCNGTNNTTTNMVSTNTNTTNITSSNIVSTNGGTFGQVNVGTISAGTIYVGGVGNMDKIVVNGCSVGSMRITGLSITSSISATSISAGSIYTPLSNSSNIIGNGITVSNTNTTNISSTTLRVTGVSIVGTVQCANVSTANIYVSNGGTLMNIVSTNATISNIVSTNVTIANLTVTLPANFSRRVTIGSDYSGVPSTSAGTILDINPTIYTDTTSVTATVNDIIYTNRIGAQTLAAVSTNITATKSATLYIESQPLEGGNYTITYPAGLAIGYVPNNGGNIVGQISLERNDGNWYGAIYTEASTNRVVIANASLTGGGGIGVYTYKDTPITMAHIENSTSITPTTFATFARSTTKFESTVDSSTTSTGAIVISGGVGIAKTLTVNNIAKGSGTFDIPHPIKEGERLVHSFIEGPRCDLIYRGRVKLKTGRGEVDIDRECVKEEECAMTKGTFEELGTNVQVYLQNDTSYKRTRGEVRGGRLYIEGEEESNDIISWLVISERKDRVIREWERTNDRGYLKTEYKN